MDREQAQNKLVDTLVYISNEMMQTFAQRLVTVDNAEQFMSEVSVYTSIIVSMHTDIIMAILTDESDEDVRKFMQEILEKVTAASDSNVTVNPNKEKLH